MSKLLVSACLLGDPVRYNQHQLDAAIGLLESENAGD
jgi:uncharacterized protein YbbK (DUF523 family)